MQSEGVAENVVVIGVVWDIALALAVIALCWIAYRVWKMTARAGRKK
jgi:hypothetical protein